ncbi:hypothetical protein SCHPADRAFT_999224 [Schizopora paradoxa]|uniref:Thioredoxin domain-containing protein n=1 Tax=Schizopora paradoxa TaxID=27342 RepID=A0A0H2RHB6_9AGAM|nr:hypothetical protein SCHPADRAFT_999224 [Schizopora paradoxa]
MSEFASENVIEIANVMRVEDYLWRDSCSILAVWMTNCVNCSRLAKLIIELAEESSKKGHDIRFYAINESNFAYKDIIKYNMSIDEESGSMSFPQLISYKKGIKDGIVVGYIIPEIKDMIAKLVPGQDVYDDIYRKYAEEETEEEGGPSEMTKVEQIEDGEDFEDNDE